MMRVLLLFLATTAARGEQFENFGSLRFNQPQDFAAYQAALDALTKPPSSLENAVKLETLLDSNPPYGRKYPLPRYIVHNLRKRETLAMLKMLKLLPDFVPSKESIGSPPLDGYERFSKIETLTADQKAKREAFKKYNDEQGRKHVDYHDLSMKADSYQSRFAAYIAARYSPTEPDARRLKALLDREHVPENVRKRILD